MHERTTFQVARVGAKKWQQDRTRKRRKKSRQTTTTTSKVTQIALNYCNHQQLALAAFYLFLFLPLINLHTANCFVKCKPIEKESSDISSNITTPTTPTTALCLNHKSATTTRSLAFQAQNDDNKQHESSSKTNVASSEGKLFHQQQSQSQIRTNDDEKDKVKQQAKRSNFAGKSATGAAK